MGRMVVTTCGSGGAHGICCAPVSADRDIAALTEHLRSDANVDCKCVRQIGTSNGDNSANYCDSSANYDGNSANYVDTNAVLKSGGETADVAQLSYTVRYRHLFRGQGLDYALESANMDPPTSNDKRTQSTCSLGSDTDVPTAAIEVAMTSITAAGAAARRKMI